VTDPLGLGPIARTPGSVSENVLLHLQRLIVTGRLPPGTRLAPERMLAAELEVSRSALREALSRLEATGLIERRQGSGTRVAGGVPLTSTLAGYLERDPAAFAASAEFRIVVEPQVARLAATRVTDPEISAMRAILESTDETSDPDHSVSQDIAFHVAVAQATRNPLLTALSELTVSWTVEARVYSHIQEEGRRMSYAGHTRILHALAGHNPDSAEAAMRVHLDEIAELIERVRH
jgi:GntR family transcriptional repressor for pyruvate dehydrogenase complex